MDLSFLWPFSKRKRLPAPNPSMVGDSGTSRTAGHVSGYELNPVLRNPAQRAKQFADMLATDAKVAGVWDLTRNTLLSAEWSWRAPRGSGLEGERNADFLNRAFGMAGHPGRMLEPWETNLERLLGFIPQGWCVAVPEFYFADGSWWVKRYKDVEPSAFQRWVWDESGELYGMVQRSGWNYGEDLFIPADQMLHLSIRQTGQNLHGVGLCRPCWIWYQLKLHAAKQIGVGLERWATPLTIVESFWTLARDAGILPEQFQAERARMEQIAQRIQSREGAYGASSEFNKLSLLGDGAFDPGAATSVINTADEQMLTAWGAMFMQLGMGGEDGSRAIGQVHESVFRRGAVNLNDKVANQLGGAERPGGGHGAQLLRWEFYDPRPVPPDVMPILTQKGLKAQALADALSQLPGLVDRNILTAGQLNGPMTDLFGLDHDSDWQPLGVSTPVGKTEPGGTAGRPPESGPAV